MSARWGSLHLRSNSHQPELHGLVLADCHWPCQLPCQEKLFFRYSWQRSRKHSLHTCSMRTCAAQTSSSIRCSKRLSISWSSRRKGKEILYIWSRFAVRYHPPPPTWYGPKTCVLQHSAWKRCICSVFLHGGVAGAVRNPANSLDFCNQPSENVLFAMFRLRHRGVVPPRPLLFLCQIII